MSSKTTLEVDVVVLGLGSAGEQVSKMLAERGKRVVGFEPHRVGGECPFVACIPSKSLLHDAHIGSTWTDAVDRRDELVDHRDDEQHADGLTDAGVTLVRESAQIVDEKTVESESHRVQAEHIIVATGSAPVFPDIDGLDRESIWTSDAALASGERPERLVVIGGGAIGSELAEVYCRFGSDVTILERRDVLTDDAEPEISAELQTHLESLGVRVHLGADVSSVEGADSESGNGDVVRLAGGTTYPADRVLLAAGVSPRLDVVGLEAIGLSPDSVEIDRNGSVSDVPWLWAAGDVTPQSQWTHGASIQARALVDRLTGQAWPEAPTVMPRATFTNPPLGVVGETSAAARDRGIDVAVGRADYTDVARASTDEIGAGKAALVVDRSTGAILGASVFGERADDLVQIVTAFMASGADVETARRTVFPFPTLSQVVERAIGDAASQLGH